MVHMPGAWPRGEDPDALMITAEDAAAMPPGRGEVRPTLGGAADRAFFADDLPAPTFGTGGIMWASLTLALLTLPVVIVATEEALAAVPPFDWPLAFNAHLKDAASAKYGEPPYGHAELSRLDQFARRTGLELPAAVAALKAAGIQMDSDRDTLQAIGVRNGRSPQEIYQIMQAATSPAAVKAMPVDPPPGTGQKTLADICRAYDLPVSVVIQALQTDGWQVDPELTLKEIGAKNGISPMDVYATIRQAAVQGRGNNS